jgi:hypothetical protein
MPLQLLANAFAAISIVLVLIRFVLLCWNILNSRATVLPSNWTPQRQLRFRRIRSVLWFIGPVSWLFWFLLPARQHLEFNHGLLATEAAFSAGILACYIAVWQQAICPGDYSKHGAPMILAIVSLLMSIVTIILGAAYYFLLNA